MASSPGTACVLPACVSAWPASPRSSAISGHAGTRARSQPLSMALQSLDHRATPGRSPSHCCSIYGLSASVIRKERDGMKGRGETMPSGEHGAAFLIRLAFRFPTFQSRHRRLGKRMDVAACVAQLLSLSLCLIEKATIGWWKAINCSI